MCRIFVGWDWLSVCVDLVGSSVHRLAALWQIAGMEVL
jgi:hypothetical protein